MKNINIIGIWPNLFRAIEIAKTGNFNISVYFDKNEYPNGNEDYQVIKNFCKDFFNDFVKKGDINITLTKPDLSFFIKKNQFETLKDIEKRIDKTKQFLTPVWLPDIGATGLLKNAIDKMDLSLLQIDNIEKISATIAQMEFSTNITAYHVAEAIQYICVWDKENKINYETIDTITITWNISDILDRTINNGIKLTDNQAREILTLIDVNQSADTGVNWDVIDFWIDEYLNNKL